MTNKQKLEGIFIEVLDEDHGKKGTVFYTELKDNNIAAKAFYHNRKVTTERIIAVNASSTWINFTSKPITRVTLH